MYTILILSVLAAATAAPHYHHHHGHHPPFHGPHRHPPYTGFGEELFDTRAFWEEMAKEMKQLDEILKDFYSKFPSSVTREGIDGNRYKIVIPLIGYKEKEIAVKAREGVLMVQAVHSTEGSQRSYIDLRTLPDFIDLSGTWTYDNDVLNIQFPLKADASTAPTTGVETAFTTATPELTEHSREEVGHENDDILDVDVGARGDNDKNVEIFTNEIPDKDNVEATTYAVDLQNEVEFVPVPY